ncbi:hypothetical protein B0H15DRAFT_254939 [Mycena belliarum]|uniref:Uncharacterized protein n=1 Tax=Mycena belliarum TaxID=1033014 RepID=A0AAD6U4B6_9AGAR|nr:hypothetical protein B0H15DRAFT_254939 [Mycena belliae]
MSYFSSTSASKSESALFVPAVPLVHDAPLSPSAAYTPARRPPSRRSQRAVPSPVKGAAILCGFLPLPPTLAVIYIACGHVVLRAAHPAHYDTVPLVSSARAAAVGGAILTLPLAVLLYILLFPTKPPEPEDFFDDDDDGGEQPWTYVAYAACAVLLLVLGAIAGALGTVCLPESIRLSAAQAARAGIVGGAIICAGFALLAALVFVFWWDCCRRNPAT